ncbi:hypothetical protein L1987_71875 [Smallanthus sonchifolius]|uniref:Uncharacterized protein n=1 Tax=Smallanthus sonchifolius TaxID=185202 RepID=A0ACB9ATM5_9ASTR|nr:hypothetical protein L1987_71875 [Smallanthus sonchifolius]
MASNPPFQVEDTDEDFFDKLVNDDDDDGYKVTSLSEATNLADGEGFDDAKAFANLGISDVGAGVEDLGKVGIGEEELVNGDIEHESTTNTLVASSSFAFDTMGEEPNVEVSELEEPLDSTATAHTLVYSNSFAFDSLNEVPNTDASGLEEPLDSTASGNHGSVDAPGVKEVQWAAFTAKPVENGSNGFGSYSDFFTEFGDDLVEQKGERGDLVSSQQNVVSGSSSVVDDSLHMENSSYNSHQFQELQAYGEQSSGGQDPNSSQYWENLYPGWKYDANTGQWYQVDDAAANVQGAYDSNTASEWTASNEVSYLQQTTQSVVGAVAEKGTNESVTSWNSVSQENNGYPLHMVFDPQYPGWYYDLNTQEWCSLDAYNSGLVVQDHDQVNQNRFFSANMTSYGNDQKTYGKQDQLDKLSGSEDFSSQGQNYNWKGSFSNSEQQGLTMWQPAQDQVNQNGFSGNNTYYGNDENMQSGFEGFSSQGQNYKLKGSVSNVEQQGSTIWGQSNSDFTGNQGSHGNSFPSDNHVNQSFHYGGTASSFTRPGQVSNEFPGAQSFVPGGNFNQPFSQSTFKQSEMMNIPKTYGGQNQASYSHQVSTAGRSSAGAPSHALVSFGFGGKLIVMKDSATLMNPSYGSQGSNGGSISVHNLAEVFTGGANGASGVCDYFETLGLQSLPGPLAAGNVGSKELSKWIDERITHSDMDYRNSEVLKLLLSLLKIASQHYGKLRSPFGTDATSKENDAPEVAVARLFASVRKNIDYGHFSKCLQQLPSEGEIQVTAAEVQTLLVSGRKIEALQRAQEGQLWGPALVLAAQLGDQFYVDTVRKMALRQLVAGSPLRTLCLLIAGQPADVFSNDTTTDGILSGAVNNMSQQPAQVQAGANCVLENWEENLAVIAANRTKDDELVLIHLGDCLWKERSNIIAAHICYLVAEANFEPYSDTARLCLIGADHWKHPRTYASPEAIQRTEVYEYAKLLGNSQFTLLPFQPYKLLYAYMLAEVGRVPDSLKYCQSVSKSIKTGRAPEVETWRQMASSLEERIKAHQQGGFSTKLAAGKIAGKLLNLIDSTAHRVVGGGLPPPVPSISVGNMQNDHHHHQQQQQHHHQHQYQPAEPRVSTSQSTMAISSLVPSASMEPINQWSDDADKKIVHNRSVSEPDFGRSPKQVDNPSKKSSESQNNNKASSRFGRFAFGTQLLQKTVELLKPRGEKQAKLGDTNKFYYDEKLKRWVEEGADPPAEESALPPPPTMATFQNGGDDYNLNTALNSEGSTTGFTSPSPMSTAGHTSGIPPIPTATSNQFSARSRLGVRARYVDTFNPGGGGGKPTNLFHSPPTSTIKPATNTNPKLFVPTPSPSSFSTSTSTSTSTEQPPATEGTENNSFQSLPQPSSAMARQKFSSLDNVSGAGIAMPPGTRRIASWGGSGQSFSFSNKGDSFMPSEPPGLIHSSMINDDLQDVDL